MVDALSHCEEGSDEYMMFYGVMAELESLCGDQFSCFIVQGFTKVEEEGMTVYQAKIRVSEAGDSPIVHAKINVHAPNPDLERGPEIVAFKKGQTEEAPFDFGENDTVFRALANVEEGGMAVDEAA